MLFVWKFDTPSSPSNGNNVGSYSFVTLKYPQPLNRTPPPFIAILHTWMATCSIKQYRQIWSILLNIYFNQPWHKNNISFMPRNLIAISKICKTDQEISHPEYNKTGSCRLPLIYPSLEHCVLHKTTNYTHVFWQDIFLDFQQFDQLQVFSFLQ